MSASSEFTGKSFRPKGTPTTLTSGTGTFTPPVDGTWYRYTIQGAGAGGAGGNADDGGGGGGAGEELTGIIKIAIAGLAYQVPAGGTGVAANTNGVDGGAAVLGPIRACGGRGGRRANIGSSDPGFGGIGGGSKSLIYGSTPGGAGGSANAVAVTQSRSPGMPPGYPNVIGNTLDLLGLGLSLTAVDAGGTGGSSRIGAGGAGGASGAGGSAATGFGAGGGGGGKGTTTGAAGSGGRIYLEPLGVW